MGRGHLYQPYKIVHIGYGVWGIGYGVQGGWQAPSQPLGGGLVLLEVSRPWLHAALLLDGSDQGIKRGDKGFDPIGDEPTLGNGSNVNTNQS